MTNVPYVHLTEHDKSYVGILQECKEMEFAERKKNDETKCKEILDIEKNVFFHYRSCRESASSQ